MADLPAEALCSNPHVDWMLNWVCQTLRARLPLARFTAFVFAFRLLRAQILARAEVQLQHLKPLGRESSLDKVQILFAFAWQRAL